MKKLLSLLLILTLAIGLLTACGDKKAAGDATASTQPTQSAAPSQSTEPTPAPQKEVALRTVSMFGGTDPTAPFYQQLIKEFTDANPNIKVTDESAISDETWKAKVATDFSSGNDPDVVFYFNGPDAKQLIDNKKVVSIEEIQKTYPDYAKDISSAAMGFMEEFDGMHYAVPVRGFYEGLFCNKDLFDKYSLELPTDWAKLEAAVTKFAAEGIVPIAASFSDVPHYWIEHLILAEGGIEDHRINPKDSYPESWATALTYFKKLKDLGAFPADLNATKNDITSNLFYDKKAAMVIDGSWFIGGIKDPATTVILPFPATPSGKKDPSDVIGGFSAGFYISTNAWNDPDKRDAAVKFVMALTTKESIAVFCKPGGGPAADVPVPTDLTEVQKSGLKMAGAAKGIDMPIDSRLSKEAWTYFVSSIGSIADGADVKEVLTEVVNLNK